MKWNKYTLTTTTEAEDLISSMMMDAGIEGIEIEDKIPLSEKVNPRCSWIFFRKDRQMMELRRQFLSGAGSGQCRDAGSCPERTG